MMSFGVSIVKFEQISYILLVFPLVTLNKGMVAGEQHQLKSGGVLLVS